MDHWKPPDGDDKYKPTDPFVPSRISQHSRPPHLEHTYPAASNSALASALAFSSSAISPPRPRMRTVGKVSVAASLPRLTSLSRHALGFGDGRRSREDRELDLSRVASSFPKPRTGQVEAKTLQQLLLHAGRHEPVLVGPTTAGDLAPLQEQQAVNEGVATADSMPRMSAAALAAALQLPSIIGKVRSSISTIERPPSALLASMSPLCAPHACPQPPSPACTYLGAFCCRFVPSLRPECNSWWCDHPILEAPACFSTSAIHRPAAGWLLSPCLSAAKGLGAEGHQTRSAATHNPGCLWLVTSIRQSCRTMYEPCALVVRCTETRPFWGRSQCDSLVGLVQRDGMSLQTDRCHKL
jgi:hypothetical protein